MTEVNSTHSFIHHGWKEQNLIKRDDLVDFIRQNVIVAESELPAHTVGKLYCVGGISKTADAIMDYLEERALEMKRKGIYPDGVHHSQG